MPFHAYAAPRSGLPAPRFWLTNEFTTPATPTLKVMSVHVTMPALPWAAT
ncbi:MAG: hypothetical protein AAFY58_00980 [Planctomycetota bacterium]